MSAAVCLILLAWVGLGNAGEVQETATGVGTAASVETSFAIRTYEAMGFSNQAWYGTAADSRIELFSNQPGMVAIYLESELMGGLLFEGRNIQTGQFFDAKSGIHAGLPQQRRFQVNDLGIGGTLTDIEIKQSKWVNYEWEFFWAKFTMRLQGEIIMQGEIRFACRSGKRKRIRHRR